MIKDKIINVFDTNNRLAYASDLGGYFALPKKSVSDGFDFDFKVFFTCREQIFHLWRINSLIFVLRRIDINKINIFFEGVENRLNVKIKTKFYKTNHNDAIFIQFSPFWSKYLMRKSLVLLFLRLAAVYYRNNLKIAIDTYPLAKISRNAIYLFLNGYTIPVSNDLMNDNRNKIGFVARYGNRTKAWLKKELTKQGENYGKTTN